MTSNSSDHKVVVISQSMYFPWCGFFDLMRLADIFVHYDDVQLSRGFYNRVQVKTPHGTTMLTVPLAKRKKNQLINESLISYDKDWITEHRAVLLNSYKKTAFVKDAIELFDTVHEKKYEELHNLTRASMIALANYFGLDKSTSFFDSIDLNIGGMSSERLMNITKFVGGTIYLTGHGALNYLDHELFEDNKVEVNYINYRIDNYTQVFGSFTPFVSALDAVAHLGSDVCKIIKSKTTNWRKAIERPEELRP